jgi:branched-chain amino acid transport system substrate-binding protein
MSGKNHIKRSAGLAAAVASVVLGAVPGFADTIKIGAYVSATGPNAFLGDPEMKTFRLYVDQINAAGGIKGQKVELVAYDDAGDTTQARSFALRLVKQDKASIVLGGSNTGVTMAAVPVFQDEEIPFISLAGAIVITTPVKEWVFKVPASDRIAAERTMAHMNAHGITKLAILNGSDGYGVSGRVQTLEAAKAAGIAVVADEVYAPTDTDMTAQLTRIRNSGAQAILNFGIGASPSIIARNVKQLGLTQKLYLSPAVASKSFLENTGAAAEGVYIPVSAVLLAGKLPASHPQAAVAAAFKSTYEASMKEEASYGAAIAYDAVRIATGAIERVITAGRKPTPDAIRSEIEKTTGYVGLNGVVNMTPKDHMGLDSSAFIIAVVKDGDWQLAQ